MKETNKIPLNNVIIKKENLIGLAKCISRQDNVRNICFLITFMNEQEIESDCIDIFENEKVNEYEIKRIYMSYVDNDYTKNIKVYIYNYEKYLGNSYIEISYDNDDNMDWLASVEKEFKEQISYCDNRNKIISFLQNDNILFFGIMLFNIIVSVFLGRIVYRITKFDPKTVTTLMFLFCTILIFESMHIRDLFYKSFPKVELDIKEKNNSAKKSRNVIKITLSTYILPIIVDIICYYIEKHL